MLVCTPITCVPTGKYLYNILVIQSWSFIILFHSYWLFDICSGYCQMLMYLKAVESLLMLFSRVSKLTVIWFCKTNDNRLELLSCFINAIILFCRPYRIVTITSKIKYFSWRSASCCSLPWYQYFDEKFQFTIYRKRQNKNLCHYEGTIIFKSCYISRLNKKCFI